MSSACTRWIALTDREAIGETLDEPERAFVREHGATCRACGAEADVFRTIEALVDDEVEIPLAPRRWRWRWVAASVAAAAALALGFAQPWAAAPPVASVPSTPSIENDVVLSLTSGDGIEVDGRQGQLGQRITRGSVVFARDGAACLHLATRVRACVTRGSLVRVADTGAALRLELLGGKVVSELDPLPAGTSYGVTTRDGAAVAVGTAFSVEVPPGNAAVVTRVLHGTVLVRATRGTEHRVGAHETNVMGHAPTALGALDEEGDLALVLGAPRDGTGTATRIESDIPQAAVVVDDRLVGTSPVALLLAPGEHVVTLTSGTEVVGRETVLVTTTATQHRIAKPLASAAPVPSPPVVRPVATAPRAESAPPAPEEPAPNARALLADARERRARGDLDGAMQTYRALLERHAGSAEAHAALVPFGELELTHAHDPAGALVAFERYLLRGGALEEEASFGRIRAFRASGRIAEERLATDAFVQRFPNGALAGSLRRP